MKNDASTVERLHDLLDRDLPLSHDPELAKMVAANDRLGSHWRYLATLNAQIIAGTGRRARGDLNTQQLQDRVMARIHQLRQARSGSPAGYWRVGIAMAACLMIGVITGGAWKNLAAKQAPSDSLASNGSPGDVLVSEPFFYEVAKTPRIKKPVAEHLFSHLSLATPIESDFASPAAISPSQLLVPIVETAATDLGAPGKLPAFVLPVPIQSHTEFLLFGSDQ